MILVWDGNKLEFVLDCWGDKVFMICIANPSEIYLFLSSSMVDQVETRA